MLRLIGNAFGYDDAREGAPDADEGEEGGGAEEGDAAVDPTMPAREWGRSPFRAHCQDCDLPAASLAGEANAWDRRAAATGIDGLQPAVWRPMCHVCLSEHVEVDGNVPASPEDLDAGGALRCVCYDCSERSLAYFMFGWKTKSRVRPLIVCKGLRDDGEGNQRVCNSRSSDGGLVLLSCVRRPHPGDGMCLSCADDADEIAERCVSIPTPLTHRWRGGDYALRLYQEL